MPTPLRIEAAPSSGTYRVVGTFFFNPGTLDAAEHVTIFALPASNAVELSLMDWEQWPGNGVMRLTAGFTATEEELRRNRYVMVHGNGLRHTAGPIDSSLPLLNMEAAGAAGEGDVSVPVGSLLVRVRKHPEIYYYGYLLPIGAILLVLMYRKLKYFRKSPE